MRKPLACWLCLSASTLVIPELSTAQDMDIRDFVRQAFIHGVPYDQASEYDSTAMPILLEMLANPGEQEHWTVIVGVLGIVGDENAVEPLTSFVTTAVEGTLSHAHYTAKSSVPLALGYLVNRTTSQRALTYLIESLDPNVWTARGVTWQSPYLKTDAERNLQLTIAAILGLALSGRPEAAQALRAAQADTTEAGKRLQAQVGAVMSDALQVHAEIARLGLAEYDRTRTPR
jgi:hypothetical protein